MISAALSVPNIVAAAVMKTFLEPFSLLLGLIAFPSALFSQCQQTAAAGSMQSLKPSAGDCWPGLQSPSTEGPSGLFRQKQHSPCEGQHQSRFFSPLLCWGKCCSAVRQRQHWDLSLGILLALGS